MRIVFEDMDAHTNEFRALNHTFPGLAWWLAQANQLATAACHFILENVPDDC
jgi:hypothetical protein